MMVLDDSLWKYSMDKYIAIGAVQIVDLFAEYRKHVFSFDID